MSTRRCLDSIRFAFDTRNSYSIVFFLNSLTVSCSVALLYLIPLGVVAAPLAGLTVLIQWLCGIDGYAWYLLVLVCIPLLIISFLMQVILIIVIGLAGVVLPCAMVGNLSYTLLFTSPEQMTVHKATPSLHRHRLFYKPWSMLLSGATFLMVYFAMIARLESFILSTLTLAILLVSQTLFVLVMTET